MTVRTDQHTDTDICLNCGHFLAINVSTDQGLEQWGECLNTESDHCQHVMTADHCPCEKFGPRLPRIDDARRTKP